MGRKVNIWKRGNIIFKTSLFQLISKPKPYKDPTKNSIKESARNIISEIVSTEIGHVLKQFAERNLMLNSFRQSGCCQRWCSTCLQETICNLTSQKKEVLKFILIISFTSYWYYTCCCRLNDSLAGFQIVENKAPLPHLPFLSHWLGCYLHSFYPIWTPQQKGLFSPERLWLKSVWWQPDENVSCFHGGILAYARFPLGLCG